LSTLKKWLKRFDEGGEEALREQQLGRPVGSGTKLSKRQFNSLQNLVETKTPEQCGLLYFLWSREAVQSLIWKKFKIKISIRHISEIMKKLGFTPQKPKLEYLERQEDKVKKWIQEEYPKIVKEAKAQGAEIHWSDETGIQNIANDQKSYAPKGQTPVFKKTGRRLKSSIISSVTNKGKIRFMIYAGGLTADKFIEFLRRLIKSAERKIFVIVDNLPTHKTQKVTDWVNTHSEQIRLIYLPAYSPDLNPTELVNGMLKKTVFKERRPKTQKDLDCQARRAMKKMQNQKEKVVALFEHPSVRYARAA